MNGGASGPAGWRTFRAGLAQARGEAVHVRGVRTAVRYLAWLGRRLRWLARRGAYREPALPAPRRAAESRPAAGATGTPVGPTARDGALPRSPCAFDPRSDNPVGWTANVERRVLALGPWGRLPVVGVEARDALRHAHHVVDASAACGDVPARARALVRLAARGVPVHLPDPEPALGGLVGGELFGLMRAGVPLGDLDRREAASIRMRRAAHRDHVRRPAGWPAVSVLLATRRPARLAQAVANVARQDYPRLELVLALHGDGFGDLPAVRGDLAVRTVRVGGERPLGAALDAAAALAGGELLAKMDDDDCYGARHILDLVLARAYSGAALVGCCFPRSLTTGFPLYSWSISAGFPTLFDH